MLGLIILAAPILAAVWIIKFLYAHPWVFWVVIVPVSLLVLAQVPKWEKERKRKADLLFANAKPAQMGPIEYENYCAEVLRRDGWHTETTPASGDQGVDVVATLQGVKAVLQCKRYNKPVGNRAVQEINAGKAYYRAQIAAVVSTAPYTPSAQALAKRCGVLLLSHRDLPDLRRQIAKDLDAATNPS
ncbi:MAG: restriction endonuclease [Acidithiobacillus sp.]